MASTLQSSTPPHSPLSVNSWPSLGAKSLFISHSLMRCGWVSARHTFSGSWASLRSMVTVRNSFMASAPVERDGSADQRDEGVFIDAVALAKVDGATGIALKA